MARHRQVEMLVMMLKTNCETLNGVKRRVRQIQIDGGMVSTINTAWIYRCSWTTELQGLKGRLEQIALLYANERIYK